MSKTRVRYLLARHGLVWLSSCSLAWILALPALAGDGENEDSRVVIRQVTTCPEIALGDGKDIQWLGLSSRGFLGIEASAMTSELRIHFGVPQDAGILVGKVVEGSAAAAAGLQVGDIVTRVGGQNIASVGDLGRVVRNKDKGDAVEIELWRAGAKRQLTATLQADERCAFDVSAALDDIDWSELETMGSEISREAVESALEGVRQAFEGVEWQQHLKELEELDLEGLEERLERVNERLQGLEKELEERLEQKMSAVETERLAAEEELAHAERARKSEKQAMEREKERQEVEQEISRHEREAAQQERVAAEQAREREQALRDARREQNSGLD